LKYDKLCTKFIRFIWCRCHNFSLDSLIYKLLTILNSYLKIISSMQVTIPRNIYLAPNIRIKALNNVGFRFAKFALLNSDLHVLNMRKINANLLQSINKKYYSTLLLIYFSNWSPNDDDVWSSNVVYKSVSFKSLRCPIFNRFDIQLNKSNNN